MMLDKIRIVLVAPTHPGNIGAAARAMKTMGLTRLYLVNPKIFPHVDATAMAAGADDLLAGAVIVDSLDEALRDCNLVIGTSARRRELPLPVLNMHEAAIKILREPQPREIAIVFGRESSGLSNSELLRCNYHINIPTNPDFSSLNLAAAVQLIAYEIRMANNEVQTNANSCAGCQYDEFATCSEVELFYKHLEQVLTAIDFLTPPKHKRLMQRLRRLFNRTRLEKMELNILRGMLSAMQKKIHLD